MNGLRNWLARYMMGRYGNDELNRFLLIVSAILIVIGIFVPRHFLNWLVVVILILAYCRMFSRNIAKRQQENMKYLQIKARVTGGRGGSAGGGGARRYGNGGYAGPQSSYDNQGGTYSGTGAGANPGGGFAGGRTGRRSKKKMKPDPGKRIFICPYCKGTLQVPVGAGKIRIKCPHCGRDFEETV